MKQQKQEEEWKRDPLSAFKLGLSCVFKSWDALQLAIQYQFTPNAAQKAVQFEEQVLKYFLHKKLRADFDELLNALEEMMMTQFETDADDGSLERIALLLTTLYKDCFVNFNYEGLHILITTASNKGKVEAHEGEAEDDSQEDYDDDEDLEEDEGDEEDGEEDEEKVEDAAPQLVDGGQRAAGGMDVDEDYNTSKAGMMDDDGEGAWETVPVKYNSSSNKKSGGKKK